MVNESVFVCLCVVLWIRYAGKYRYVYLPVSEGIIRDDKEETEKKNG